MKVFKIVTDDLKSFSAEYLENPELILQYSTEEWTTPECGYIFAFKTERDVRRYITSMYGRQIFEAEARVSTKKVKEIPYPRYIRNLKQLCKFWKTLNASVCEDVDGDTDYQYLPAGTVLCKSLILKKRIA